jgi:hypothetical protein
MLALSEIVLHLEPVVWVSVLTSKGSFSCQAEIWFYNMIYFPGRTEAVPSTIKEFVAKAVSSLSAERLNGCTQDSKFLAETTFQHLLIETMALHLPVTTSVKPECPHKS